MKALFVGGRFNGQTMTTKEIFATCWNGKFTPNWSEARAHGAIVPRAELDNQPMVDGYLCPMWDGGMLRYETAEAYDILSR